MLKFIDILNISADRKRIAEWFRNLPQHYRDWHPADHIKLQAVNSTASKLLQNGSRFYAEEYMGSFKLKMIFKIVQVNGDRYTLWKAEFPNNLINLHGDFAIEGDDPPLNFTARIFVGWDTLIGRACDPLLWLLLPTKDISRHMREEGLQLKFLMESSA